MIRWMLLPLVLALTGCSTATPPASDVSGAGFVMARPSAATRQFIIANDRDFAERTAVNITACERATLCRK